MEAGAPREACSLSRSLQRPLATLPPSPWRHHPALCCTLKTRASAGLGLTASLGAASLHLQVSPGHRQTSLRARPCALQPFFSSFFLQFSLSPFP